MMLVIDIGNTRIKWATLDDGVLGAQSATSYSAWEREDIVRTVFAQGPRPQRVIAANVGGSKIGELLRDAARAAWNMDVQFVHSTAQAGGVRNAYPEPANLGVDRLMAMIGAHAMKVGPACIVSVGTAMTIDALDVDGQHLGGVIVPGPDLMTTSLLRNTSEIATRAAQGNIGADVFADNTLGAVKQGAVHALAALVERAVQSMQVRISATPALLLTGGASAALDGLLQYPYRHVPDLVLRGLAVVADPR